jgi:hypothetical protein
MATPFAAYEAGAVPRLSTARKRTPLVHSARAAARLSSAQTARADALRLSEPLSLLSARGASPAPYGYGGAVGYPVEAHPAYAQSAPDSEGGIGALRRTVENLCLTLVLQSFLRWKVRAGARRSGRERAGGGQGGQGKDRALGMERVDRASRRARAGLRVSQHHQRAPAQGRNPPP